MKYPAALLLLPALTLPGHALYIRDYNSAVHDRVFSIYGATTMNPSFIHGAARFTGVGWSMSEAYKQITMISPTHFVCSNHNAPGLTHTIRFVASDGSIVSRTVQSLTPIAADTTGESDLKIGTLSAPVPSTVKPLPYLNFATEFAYTGKDLMVFGYVMTAGSGNLLAIEDADFDGGGPNGATKVFTFDYLTLGTDPDDCYYQGGDSGSPCFIEEGGQPALVGINAATISIAGGNLNFGTFIPHYIAKVDVLLAPSGYRMRPAIFTPTTLALTSTSTPANLLSGSTGSVDLTIGNTGSETTGNLAVTISFPISLAPSSITATGCVVESVSTGVWQVRKAVVAAAENIVITAAWTSLPNTSELTATVAVESDTTTASTHPLNIPVAQTYASWSQGLSEAAEEDDPDDDGEVNLLEYAFGSPPNSGSYALPGGVMPFPVLVNQAGTVTLSYPERTQAALLGLSYAVETTTDPGQPSWPLSLPVGWSTSTQPYVPAIPGFVKRTLTWPADGPRKFARVRVELAE